LLRSLQWISYASFSALLWVPETPRTSRDLLILVEQSTEPVAPSDGDRLARRRLGEWSEGSGLAEPAVWPVAVVVLGVLGVDGALRLTL
jgi:hypothetical protein